MEFFWILAICPHHVICRPSIEKYLIRTQQTSPVNKCLEIIDDKLSSPPFEGHLDFLSEATKTSTFVPLYNWLRNTEQRATPAEWAPESTTISLAVKPLSLKFLSSSGRSANGDGRFSAPFLFAVLASLFPNGTDHEGPPSYYTTKWKIISSSCIFKK